MLTTREMYILPAYDHSAFPLLRAVAALVLAIAPLFINIGYTTSFNGRVTSYADFADVVLGLVLLMLAINTLSLSALSGSRYKTAGFVVMTLLALTAVAHVISGSGLLVR